MFTIYRPMEKKIISSVNVCYPSVTHFRLCCSRSFYSQAENMAGEKKNWWQLSCWKF